MAKSEIKRPRTPAIQEGYMDHNGLFVTHTIHHGETPGRSDVILRELYRLLNSKRVPDSNCPIQISDHRYPEYKTSEIKKYFKEQQAKCTITQKESFEIIEDCGLIDYTLLLPLWYIVYRFLETYQKTDEFSISQLKNSTKKGLRDILRKYENDDRNDRNNNYINHSIMVIDMSMGAVYDIGG